MNPVIEVKGVYKSFKNVQAVNGVDFEIIKGQSVALLGPNGAGKTTLMEMIEGIQKPDAGEIFVLGRKWKGNEDTLHQQIGLSLQETHFLDRLSVRETLVLFASFYCLDRRRVDEIIQLIDLAEKSRSYVANLSGGQRQRLAIGIALLNHPKLLLLDEPTTGLDPNARREIWSILLRLKQQSQTSLILTTHYMEEAEQLCDRIIIIDHGRILKKGTLSQLLEAENGPKIIEFSLEAPAETNGFAPSRFQIQWAAGQGKGSVILSDIETELPEFIEFISINKLRLKTLECRRKTLDDLFIEMTGRRLDD
ncbi:MAG: ABC transporter ATP-binding protein [Desulfobacteraceae bacterium]|nr:MAG: ABC transporter ATP-binding protein [Desulfobacteraceae bacterium]